MPNPTSPTPANAAGGSCPLQRDKLVPKFCEVIPSTLTALFAVLEKVLAVVQAIPCAPEEIDDVDLALREALANAILHGNQSDPTKRVAVACFCECEATGGLLLVVRDEGSGFDPAEVPDPTTADAIYSAALTDYTKRSYDQAIRGFQAFIAQYPRDNRVADAQWWLADTYYSMENYPQAIKEYDVVVRSFPDSPQAPAAMFKQGLAYLQSNDPTGCRILRDMMAKYPRTREAGRAREELRQPICR